MRLEGEECVRIEPLRMKMVPFEDFLDFPWLSHQGQLFVSQEVGPQETLNLLEH